MLKLSVIQGGHLGDPYHDFFRFGGRVSRAVLDHVGVSLGRLESSWRQFGAILGRLEAICAFGLHAANTLFFARNFNYFRVLFRGILGLPEAMLQSCSAVLGSS